MIDAGEIRALEEQLLQPDFRRNRAAVAALLADEFREFGSSGRIWNKQQILDHLEFEVPFEAVMQDFDATELADGVVLATYVISLQSSESESHTSLRSSVWIEREGHWQMLFHHGTLTTRSWSDHLKSSSAASPGFMEDVEDPPPQEHGAA